MSDVEQIRNIITLIETSGNVKQVPKISDFIAKLQAIKAEHGDLEIWSFTHSDDWCDPTRYDLEIVEGKEFRGSLVPNDKTSDLSKRSRHVRDMHNSETKKVVALRRL
jgi:hypothetical protein